MEPIAVAHQVPQVGQAVSCAFRRKDQECARSPCPSWSPRFCLAERGGQCRRSHLTV